ncbi:hypothetical protein [uncultured Psychroserpens sp.]|uniref:hypothetical protein n=1 Tax=uncultured Psychroserpens sp. TaxID=255436 RepID=UPI002610E6EF|nr:hypothetical protein [uncultured Psychroserpens sp.]
MEDINTIYYNNFGIAFQWKRCAAKDVNKIQLVFRNTGLYFRYEELISFSHCINSAFKEFSQYSGCEANGLCRPIVLQTPCPEVSFAINKTELRGIHDLLKGTLFHLDFDNILNEILSK